MELHSLLISLDSVLVMVTFQAQGLHLLTWRGFEFFFLITYSRQ